MGKFYINQRVFVGDEIGTVQRGRSMVKGPPMVEPTKGYVWVHLPSKGYASCFSEENVDPLPNGQF
jgi:hypothetical protein